MLKDEKLDDKIFELQEKIDITGQTEHLYAQRPIWLPQPSINILDNYASIIQTFQNLSFIGELRQRWEEIKKLQSKPSLAL